MSTGGGNSFFESALDVALNATTLGNIGYKSDDDGVGLGVGSRQAVKQGSKILKDVTGATAAEEANADARKRFEEEKVAADQERQNIQAQSAARQLAASRSAASSRGGVSTTSSTGQSRFSNLGSDEADFLGL